MRISDWSSDVCSSDLLDGDLFLTDDFGGQNGEKLPGYELVNAQLSWNGIAGTGLNVGAFVKNLFDRQYLSGSSVFLQSFPISSGYLGEPRTWGVKEIGRAHV